MATMHNSVEYRPACPADSARCIEIRGRTRENAISAAGLAQLGITVASWSERVRSDALPGRVCVADQHIVGYCFGERASGEIIVLALLPEFEGQGIGRALLEQMVEILAAQGHTRLHLGCSADPRSRSYGFYRHLAWKTTHRFDDHHDEILELQLKATGET